MSNSRRPYANNLSKNLGLSKSKTPVVSSIEAMVKEACILQASDIHIRVGEIPRFRVRTEILVMENYEKVTPEILQNYLTEILTLAQRKQLAQKKDLDTAIFYPNLVRCRVNCFDTLSGGGIVLRLISLKVPSIDELKLPKVLKQLVTKPQGLIIVTGATGAGKSTTVAAMIRQLNETTNRHIITIEDPIEYVHDSRKCLITQREVGLHTYHFHQALRATLREDPDIIFIGEMRDRITIDTVLQAAQTGHLVLATLHTNGAIQAINRLLTLYNPEEQVPVKIQILESLVAVISQSLIQTVNNRPTAVHDILINTLAMQDYLLKGDDIEALRLMENDLEGMQVMNQAIYQHLSAGRVTMEQARKVSPDIGQLERMMRTGGIADRTSSREWMMER